MRDIAAEDQARLDRIAASDPIAARSFAAHDATDLQVELARNRRAPEPVKMVSEADALAAVEQVREDAARERMIADQEANARVLLAASFNAVVDGGQSPEQVVHSMITGGVPTDIAQRFLDALGETVHAPDAAQLSESLAFREANSTLNFEQAKLAADAEDRRLAAVKDDNRFKAIQAALDPEVAAKTEAIRNQYLEAELPPPPPLLTAGVAVVDTVAARNASFKQRIMDATPTTALKRGTALDREYVADLDRERERVIDRARIVPADPGVRANIERLRYAAPSPAQAELRAVQEAAGSRKAESDRLDRVHRGVELPRTHRDNPQAR